MCRVITIIFFLFWFYGNSASLQAEDFYSQKEIDYILITAPKNTLKMKNIGNSVETISDDEMMLYEADGIDDILSMSSGVTTTGGPRSSLEVPQVRGMESDKVLLLVDGSRQNYRTHHSGGLFLDPALLKRVEVMKGSASSRFGSGAMGGVVSFTTKDAHDFLRKGQKAGARLSTGYQSGNQERNEGLSLYGEEGRFDGLFHVQKRDSENIRQGRGRTLPYSGEDDFLLLSKGGYSFDEKQKIRLSYERQKKRMDVPLADATLSLLPEGTKIDVSRDRMLRQTYSLKYDYRERGGREFEGLVYQNVINTEKLRMTDGRLDERELVTSGADFTYQMPLYHTQENFASEMILGGSYFYEKQEGRRDGDTLSSYPGGNGYQSGLYGEFPLTFFSKLEVSPALRYDRYLQRSHDFQTGEKKGGNLSKSLYSNYHLLPVLDVFASYSEGYNVPRIQQLFPNGYHFKVGGQNNFVPNPHLKNEESKHYEGGIKFSKEGIFKSGDLLSSTYRYYEKDVDNYIDAYLDLKNNTTMFINKDFVHFEGHEIELGYDLEYLSLKLSYARVRAFEREGQYLSKAPADEINWHGIYYFNKVKTRLGYEGKKVFDQTRLSKKDQEPVYKTYGYLVHNVFASYSLTKKFETILRVNNIFDIKYRRHTSFNYEMGRDVRLSLSYAI